MEEAQNDNRTQQEQPYCKYRPRTPATTAGYHDLYEHTATVYIHEYEYTTKNHKTTAPTEQQPAKPQHTHQPQGRSPVAHVRVQWTLT